MHSEKNHLADVVSMHIPSSVPVQLPWPCYSSGPPLETFFPAASSERERGSWLTWTPGGPSRVALATDSTFKGFPLPCRVLLIGEDGWSGLPCATFYADAACASGRGGSPEGKEEERPVVFDCTINVPSLWARVTLMVCRPTEDERLSVKTRMSSIFRHER